MDGLDWTLLTCYLAGMVALSLWLGRRQSSGDDYYVGGRGLPWWAVGVSTMATQSSANSFVGIPAFVALAAGGGLSWLQYELAVPLGLIVVMLCLTPTMRELRLVSIYAYLERRFDRPTRLLLSGVFLLSRGLAAGAMIYASAVVLSVCLGLSVAACILLVGCVTVLYDTLGGMAAVVWSDVVQMGVLFFGLLLCVWVATDAVGGFEAVLRATPAERLQAFRPGWGLNDDAKSPFWGFLIGGFFLYISYYGVDQSQMQRQLAAPSVDGAKQALVLNAVVRFPLTVLYVVMGLTVGAAYRHAPALRAAVPAEHLDALVPHFVLQYLPSGARGLVFAAVLAAAMSTLDSALNSLSAATMRDFIAPWLDRHRPLPEADARHARELKWGKGTTVAWGGMLIAMAFLVSGMDVADTVVESINQIGSLFYGPLLAAFLSGVLDKRARGPAVIVGVLLGVACNLWLWLGQPGVFWMWWNVSGLMVASLVTVGLSRMMAPPRPAQLQSTTMNWAGLGARERAWRVRYVLLVLYFFLLLWVTAYVPGLLAQRL
ncbi:MAG: sodium:solute symporter family transporter [Polyangiales bacterium]